MSDFVIDASALVDLALDSDRGQHVDEALGKGSVIAPAHIDAEILSALGRIERSGSLTARQVASQLTWVAGAPIGRIPLNDLLAGAWRRRHNLRLSDALYVELAAISGATLVTCDRGMAKYATGAILITD